MPQINVNFDEGLYKQLQEFSVVNATAMPDIIRSAVRGACPQTQKVLVKLNDYSDEFNKRDFLHLDAKIGTVNTSFGNFWFGIIYLTIQEMGDLAASHTPLEKEYFLITSDFKYGGIRPRGYTVERDYSTISFVGLTTLNDYFTVDQKRLFDRMANHSALIPVDYRGLLFRPLDGPLHSSMQANGSWLVDESFVSHYWLLLLDELKELNVVKEVNGEYYRIIDKR